MGVSGLKVLASPTAGAGGSKLADPSLTTTQSLPMLHMLLRDVGFDVAGTQKELITKRTVILQFCFHLRHREQVIPGALSQYLADLR